DLCLVFSANPEDYTNRGRIVTPLKDRIGSVVQTHYPVTRELGMEITDNSAWTERGDAIQVHVPGFIREILEETSRLARQSPHLNQSSGVSVRMSIANFETAISNAERRGLLLKESPVVVRISDLSHITASSCGKMELAMSEDSGDENRLVSRLLSEAVKIVFDERFKPKRFRCLTEYMELGEPLHTGDAMQSQALVTQLETVPGFSDLITSITADLEPKKISSDFDVPLRASVAEFILDAMHCHNRLNKTMQDGDNQYGR
ncbi:MAG: magnesium chelatase, partial [Planctomycetaceae bacterium]